MLLFKKFKCFSFSGKELLIITLVSAFIFVMTAGILRLQQTLLPHGCLSACSGECSGIILKC